MTSKKIKDYDNCPLCQAERDGVSQGWGFSDEGWRQVEENHNKNHVNKNEE